MKLPSWHLRGEHELHRLAREVALDRISLFVANEPPDALDLLAGAPELERLKALELLGALPAATAAEAPGNIPWRELAALPYPAGCYFAWPGGQPGDIETVPNGSVEDWEILSVEEVVSLFVLIDKAGANRRIFTTPAYELLERRLTELYTGPGGPRFAPRQASERLFFGRAPLLAEEVDELAALGITHVVDFREDEEWMPRGLLGKHAIHALSRRDIARVSLPLPRGEPPSEDVLSDLVELFWDQEIAELDELDELDARFYFASRAGRGRAAIGLLMAWSFREQVRAEVSFHQLRRRGIELEITPEQRAAVNAFTLSEVTWELEGEADLGLDASESYPWGDIVACFRRDRAPREDGGETLASARARLLPGASRCPICHTPPERLRWFWFTTPRRIWELGCGSAGWMSACEDCKIHVDFECAIMS